MEITPITTTDVQELLQEFVEDGHDLDEMKEFIETHGEKSFAYSYEDYVKAVDEYGQEIVDAFLGADFDIDDIDHLSDAYYGQFRSGAEFAETFVTDTGYIENDLPYWIEIDWEKTWDNLSYDYSEYNGYIFCNNW